MVSQLPTEEPNVPSSTHIEENALPIEHDMRRTPSRSTGRLSRVPSTALTINEDLEVSNVNALRPRKWVTDLSNIPRGFFKRSLNPFKTSYWSLYRPLKSWPDRSILVAAIFLAIAGGIPLPIIGVIFGRLINEFPPAEDKLLTGIEELIGVACAYFAVTWGWTICWGIIGERVSRGLREALVEKAVGMEMAYFDVDSPDITSVLTSDTQSIQMGTSEKVGLFIQSISYFVAAFVVGFILNAKLAGILFVAIIPTMMIIVITGTSFVSKLSKRVSVFTESAANIAEGAIGAVQVVQAFGAMATLSEKQVDILLRAARVAFRKNVSGAVMLGLVYFTAYSANALAFWEGSQLESEEGGAGTIYAVVFLILDASFVVGQFGPFVQTLALAASSGGKVLALIDRPAAPINVYSEEGSPVSQETMRSDLLFEDVTFVYPARPTARVLECISLKFKPGTTTGVVGVSGSGKSTIASLLLRLYDPASGKITLGGSDLKSFNIKALRAQIALVDQDPVLFSGTLLDNIGHGLLDKPQLSGEEIYSKCITAAREASADFIEQLPDGIYTKVGASGGTQLSGGQKQRICLARALVRRPSLLILDEPTSALDSTSETLILKALDNVSKTGCTVVMIAHRLATIMKADNIIVMAHGSFLEQGTHHELIEKRGAYNELIKAQRMETNTNPAEDFPSTESTHRDNLSASNIKFEQNFRSDSNASTVVEESHESSRSSYQLLKRCMALSKRDSPLIMLGICASITSGALIIGEAIIFGHLINLLNNESTTPEFQSRVDLFCLMFFVVALVALVAYSVAGSAFGLVSEHLVNRIKNISLRTILQQDIAWFSEPGHSAHALMASINMDSGHLSGLSGVIIGTLCSVTTSVLGGIILAHVVAWKIAIVLLAAVPVMVLAGFLRLRVLAKFEQRHETAYNAAAALASEACQNIRTVAAFGREHDVLLEYRAAIQGPYRQSFRFITLGNLMLAFSLAITYFVYALAYYWGARQVSDGDYTEEQFFIVLPALLFSAQSAGQMFSLAPELTRAKSAANSVFNLHDQKPTIMIDEDQEEMDSVKEKEKFFDSSSEVMPSATPSPQRQPVIGFKNVHLTYQTRPNIPVLQDINFSVAAGEFIGIVGPSGAGKSSLIGLLERFYDVTNGAVMIDGVDVRNIPVRKHRAGISLVAQEPDLFPGSISFNVGLGVREGETASQENIERVCQSAGLHEFITSLPEGYQTECGRNGSKLSGGQKQRIAVARALIRDPEILLLDEATSSLDSRSERLVQSAVWAAREKNPNLVTLVVAHRLSSVQNADRILVFEMGRIVEVGSHIELLRMRGVYAGMVRAQDVG